MQPHKNAIMYVACVLATELIYLNPLNPTEISCRNVQFLTKFKMAM